MLYGQDGSAQQPQANERTLVSWFKDTARRDEIKVLMQGLSLSASTTFVRICGTTTSTTAAIDTPRPTSTTTSARGQNWSCSSEVQGSSCQCCIIVPHNNVETAKEGCN